MEALASSMQDQLFTMFDLQDRMNTKVHPEWRQQDFKFCRAAWIECAELMDHCGYKWWKKQEPDVNQVKLEIVDIWHFIISMYLLSYTTSEYAVRYLINDMKKTGFKPIFNVSTYNNTLVMNQAEALACHISMNRFTGRPSISVFINFIHLLIAAGMTFDELFRLYVGKNVLNLFRQDFGYKDGTYIKTWNGREDNEHLTEIMETLDSKSDSFSVNLYEKLKERYLLVKSELD